jgi:hypothetical protein
LYGSESFLTGTNTGTSASTLTDVTLKSTVAGANQFVGHWLYIDEDSDAAPEEEARMVTEYDPANGILTVDPDFSAALASGATYELHPKLHPDRLNEAINWALEFGSNNAYAEITDDDATTSAIYDKEILIEGALYYVRQGMSREEGLSTSVRSDLTQQWQQHFDRWMESLETLIGYKLPELQEEQ